MKNNVWFISDLHFTHINALYFKPKRRELSGISLEELQSISKIQDDVEKANAKKGLLMKYDAWLIQLWNETIKKEDTVYILGDFCLGTKERTEYILNKLHGKKYLIRGNHDKSCNGLERYFQWVGDIKEMKFNNDQFPFIRKGETFCVEMCHFPMVSWNRRTHGTFMLHGHVHGAMDKMNIDSEELRVDVGLDGKLANMNFISLEKLYAYATDIIEKAGFKTFQEYVDNLMEKQGIRL